MDKAISSGVFNFNAWHVKCERFAFNTAFFTCGYFPFLGLIKYSLLQKENTKLFIPEINTQITNNAKLLVQKGFEEAIYYKPQPVFRDVKTCIL